MSAAAPALMFMSARVGTPHRCQWPSRSSARCRPVTAELSDKPVTIRDLTAVTGGQVPDLLLHE